MIYLADRCVVVEEVRQNFRDKKERKMANKNLTLKLTSDQQRQIKEATGKNIAELNIDLLSSGHLSEKELDQVVGGKSGKKSTDSTYTTVPK